MNGLNDTAETTSATRSAGSREPANWTRSKSPDEIEQEIARTRARLAAAVDRLGRRLAPRRLLESGLDAVKGSFARRAEPELESSSAERQRAPSRRGNRPLALFAVAGAWLVTDYLARRRAARLTRFPHRTPAIGHDPAEAAYAGRKPAAQPAVERGRDEMSVRNPAAPPGT
jgi:hypothetical protein